MLEVISVPRKTLTLPAGKYTVHVNAEALDRNNHREASLDEPPFYVQGVNTYLTAFRVDFPGSCALVMVRDAIGCNRAHIEVEGPLSLQVPT